MIHQQITQEELRQELARLASVSEDTVGLILDQLARIAARETKTNGGFLFPGIGMIDKVEQFERTGMNPATGQEIKLPAKTKLHFRFEAQFTKDVTGK
jgi:DNA-binding protein HU-beta